MTPTTPPASAATYLIRLPADKLHAADVPASVLWLFTRVRPVRGDECRAERDALADAVGPGPLADLLRSGDGITVRTHAPDVWRIARHPDRQGGAA